MLLGAQLRPTHKKERQDRAVKKKPARDEGKKGIINLVCSPLGGGRGPKEARQREEKTCARQKGNRAASRKQSFQIGCQRVKKKSSSNLRGASCLAENHEHGMSMKLMGAMLHPCILRPISILRPIWRGATV